MPVPTYRPHPSSSLPMAEAPPSPSTVALLSLSQDISALISLSLEATASLVHNWVKHTLSTIGLASSSTVAIAPRRSSVQGEGGRGMAVVVVGASEATGQSLTLHLAKAGYTVFPFVPIPSPHSPPTSTALSTLLLTWSGIQKRLRARNPNHPGAVIPVLTDPEGDAVFRDVKGKGRFRHAGETVRAYCRENNLVLISIVCASRSTPAGSSAPHEYEHQRSRRSRSPVSIDRTPRATVDISPTPMTGEVSLPLMLPPPLTGLAATDENTLLGLYRANVLDPLSVLRELSDLLSIADLHGRGRGRVVFVNSPEEVQEDLDGALQMIGKARAETASLLRGELRRIGVDVCEVVVGPMVPPPVAPVAPVHDHLRQDSNDSNSSAATQLVTDGNEELEVVQVEEKKEPPPPSRDAILASRLAFLSKIWAVDDALLFSAVRRAIEDQYPRYRHHAGLSPLLGSLADATPGGGLMKAVGRWVLGRLLMPRNVPT